MNYLTCNITIYYNNWKDNLEPIIIPLPDRTISSTEYMQILLWLSDYLKHVSWQEFWLKLFGKNIINRSVWAPSEHVNNGNFRKNYKKGSPYFIPKNILICKLTIDRSHTKHDNIIIPLPDCEINKDEYKELLNKWEAYLGDVIYDDFWTYIFGDEYSTLYPINSKMADDNKLHKLAEQEKEPFYQCTGTENQLNKNQAQDKQ